MEAKVDDRKVEDLPVVAPATSAASKSATGVEAVVEPVESKVEDVPDPEEDDLDDLDDMLDEFSEVKTETKDTPIASGPGRPVVNSGSNGNETKLPKEESIPLNAHGMTDDDFAKQLQAGMADLLGELDTDPDLKGQWETLLKEFGGPETLGKVPGGPAAASSSIVKSTVPPSDESFQETIQKTMERMQASGDKAKAAAVEDDSDDILTELMKQMGAGALGGEGSEEDFSKMLLGMMEQLTNKEILYEPMKELDDKFPDWMKKNKDTTPEEDMKRYKEQQIVVREIVGKFEANGYADSNAADREYIVERMQKMQAAGSPPPDLVGDMAAATEALGVPGGDDEGCPQQ